MSDLHKQIMNLPCKPYDGTDAYTHYCRGHRDARHAAAGLVAAQQPIVSVDRLLELAIALDRSELPLATRAAFVKREIALMRRDLLAHETEQPEAPK